jgi:hypothetical protein
LIILKLYYSCSSTTTTTKINSEDNVEVGADLYMIDTEGTATVTADADATPTEPTATIEETSSPVETEQATAVGHVRVPSIQFLGKDGWKKKLSIVGESVTQQPQTPMKANGSIILDGGQLHPMYGRLPFSEREMEALIMGGASEVE